VEAKAIEMWRDVNAEGDIVYVADQPACK